MSLFKFKPAAGSIPVPLESSSSSSLKCGLRLHAVLLWYDSLVRTRFVYKGAIRVVDRLLGKIPEVTREDPSLVWNIGFWGVFILKNIPIFLAFVGRFSLVGKS